MLDRVGARLDGPLHGLGRRRVHGHGQAALARDAHGRGQLLAEEHHGGHHVVAAAHDAAGGDELDLVHAVEDLLAHRLDEGVGAVDGDHAPRAPERVVPRGGADRVAAAEEPRPDEPAGGERLAPRHVGPSRHAHHAQRRDAGRAARPSRSGPARAPCRERSGPGRGRSTSWSAGACGRPRDRAGARRRRGRAARRREAPFPVRLRGSWGRPGVPMRRGAPRAGARRPDARR